MTRRVCVSLGRKMYRIWKFLIQIGNEHLLNRIVLGKIQPKGNLKQKNSGVIPLTSPFISQSINEVTPLGTVLEFARIQMYCKLNCSHGTDIENSVPNMVHGSECGEQP